jgi:large subunit ribosomal protein L13
MSIMRDNTKTTLPTKTGLQRSWYILDASKEPVGRLATKAADILMGKNRSDYTPSIDMGGCVLITNSDKLVFTGKKMDKKNYFSYSNGRIGSLKVRSLSKQMILDSTRPIYLAIKRMLPKNRHQDLRMNNRVVILNNETHNIKQTLIQAN